MKKVFAALGTGAVLGAFITYAIIDRGSPAAAPEQVVRDIVDVPKMTPAAATRHREDRYTKLYSVEQIMALPSEFAETEALYVLAGRSDSGAVQNLIYEANRIAEPLARERVLGILFARLTEMDPESALAMARSPTFVSDRDVEGSVWRSWGKHDLDSALHAANSQSTTGQRNVAAQALYAAFGYMGNDTTDRIEQELGIRPDRTSRARFMYDLADRSPGDAIRYIEDLESRTAQEESVGWLGYHLSRTDTDRAPGYANLFEDSFLRERYEAIVAASAARADPRAVLDRMLTANNPRPNRSEAYNAMRELLAQDVDSALQYYEQFRSPEERQTFGFLIAQELARQDPTRAIEWAKEHPQDRQMSRVLGQIAQTDPQRAIEEAKSIQHHERRQDAIRTIASVLVEHDPSLASELIGQIPSSRERDATAASVFARWSRTDPDAALNWLMTNDEVDLERVLEYGGSRYMMTDVDTAKRILPKLSGDSAVIWRRQIAQTLASQHSAAEAQSFISQFRDSEDFESLQSAVIGGLVKSDAIAAKQMADQMPAGEARDSAYVQLVNHHADVNPREAAAWIASIGDQQQRSYATNRAASAWYSNEPEAATYWVNNLPRGPQRDDAIVGLSGHWQDISPSQRLLLDSIGDPGKRTQAQVNQLYQVARQDWRKAQSMLDNMQLASTERTRLQRTIDHYRNR